MTLRAVPDEGVDMPVPDPLYVYKGTTVNFRAVELNTPTGDVFLTGKPTWSGASGASGTGATKSVTFGTLSTSTAPIDYKTVIATQITESGSTIVKTANITVYELEDWFVPADNFSGRSTDDYGLMEVVTLDHITNPYGVSVPVTWDWTGVGTLNKVTLKYNAKDIVGAATFTAEITSGVSQGMTQDFSKNVQTTYAYPSASRELPLAWETNNAVS